MEGRKKNPKSHGRDTPATSKKKKELPVIEEGFLQFKVAENLGGTMMGRGYQVHQDFDGVLVGYGTHEPDAVKRLCQPRMVSKLVEEIRRAVQVLNMQPKRVIVELNEPLPLGGGYEGRSSTSRDRQVLLQFETAGEWQRPGDTEWVSHASQLVWHELMHAKDVLDGRWPAFQYSSFGRDAAVRVIAALGHLWIDGYLNQRLLPDLRQKPEAVYELFEAIISPDTSKMFNDRVVEVIESAGGTLPPTADVYAINRKIMHDVAPAELQLVESIADGWWGRPMDCWQTIALAASLGFPLPKDCAFAEWMRTQKAVSY